MAELRGLIVAISGVAKLGLKLSVSLYKFSYAIATPDKSVAKIRPEVLLLSAVLTQLETTLKDDQNVRLCKIETLSMTRAIAEECETALNDLDKIIKKYVESGKMNLVDRLAWPYVEKKVHLLRINLDRLKSTLMLMLEVIKYARGVMEREQSNKERDCEIIVALRKAEANANRRYEKLRADILNIRSSEEDGFSEIGIQVYNTEPSESNDQKYHVVDHNGLKIAERHRNDDLLLKLENVSNLIDEVERTQDDIAGETQHSGIWEKFDGIGDHQYRHTKITKHAEMPGQRGVRDITSHQQQSRPQIRDVYIALVGAVGTGKSTFVNLCGGESRVWISQGVGQGTESIEEYHFMYTGDIRVHLIDTPGFNDAHHREREVLMDLEEWISQSHGAMTKLSGIIYFHRISDLRMQGSAHRNLRMFEKLCGTDSLRQIILVTTNWDRDVLGNQEAAALHEQELQTHDEHWGLMVQRGSVILRHTRDRDSAMNVLNVLLPVNHTESMSGYQVEPMERRRGFSQSSIGVELQNAEAQVDQLLAEYTTVVDIPPPQQRRWTGGLTF